MATTKDFLNYFLEQCGGEVTARPMMGEYLIYYNGKLVGDICDNLVFLKPVTAVKELLPDAEMQPPYAGAKPMVLLENLDDKEFLIKLFKAMYEELPMSKPKKKVQK